MLILVASLVTLLFTPCICSDIIGRWENLTQSQLSNDSFANYYRWRGLSGPNGVRNITELTVSFTAESLCRALTMRDNCFSHSPSRAESLLRRKFTFQNAEQDPLLTLSSMRDQYILFSGDSIVLSVYQSFVCHLTQFSNATYEYVWAYRDETILSDSSGQDKCPGHPSCHLLGGKSYITRYNITIAYQQVNKYQGRVKKTLHQKLVDRISQPTFLILNLGAHYNEEENFKRDVHALHTDLLQISEDQRNAGCRVTHMLWLESFPQHFPGGAGFYQAAAKHTVPHNQSSLRCEPIADKRKYFQADWRNRAVETIMPDLTVNNRIIAVAAPLYDQWDAHVDYGDSLHTPQQPADCTHYCLGSGVFRFVVERVLTSIVACLNVGSKA